MKALLLNGAAAGDPFAQTVEDILMEELKTPGVQATGILLRDLQIACCRGCFACWLKTPGICKIDDHGREIASLVINHDLVVLLTPVTFGGYSSCLKRALDRLLPNTSPFFARIGGEVHHARRYRRYPDMLAVGLLPGPDPEAGAIFHALFRRNAINFYCSKADSLVLAADEKKEGVREKLHKLIGEREAADSV